MSIDLATIFGSLQRYHIATVTEPLPPSVPGITWIWAKHGIYKRGVNTHIDALVHYAPTCETPGLAQLAASVQWKGVPDKLPGEQLKSILDDAQRCGSNGTVDTPIEQQYFIALVGPDPRILRPRQQATSAHVAYQIPNVPILCDVHSHHWMPAYFSGTDDHDDMGLSVSVVIGRIFDTPEVAVRINVYGRRNRVPATLIFDDLGPFVDTYEGSRHDEHAYD